MLAYYLYRDLERGWRVTSPNLEQCGLLQVEYLAIDEVANDQKFWQDRMPTGISRGHTRTAQADHSCTSRSSSTQPCHQGRFTESQLPGPHRRTEPSAALRSLGDRGRTGHGSGRRCLAKEPRRRENAEDTFLSPAEQFRAPGPPPRRPGRSGRTPLRLEDTGQIIVDLFRCLRQWGLVEEVRSLGSMAKFPATRSPRPL